MEKWPALYTDLRTGLSIFCFISEAGHLGKTTLQRGYICKVHLEQKYIYFTFNDHAWYRQGDSVTGSFLNTIQFSFVRFHCMS